MHYDKHIIWINTKLVQNGGYFVFTNGLKIYLEPVRTIFLEESRDSEKIGWDSWNGSFSLYRFVVKDKGDSCRIMTPPNKVT